ncbi:hypothetical protein DFJ58DRAFT_906805 [Suillus subalutaceus]|uniref:uncharacterized protein n=1 Tax=Suillus subalutaceus TaxID=48586 RepID=UPI001B882BB1|nr:uncharacterized protein DFJ58DRAFT_906805 [Suillus subalutaceus]KAG1848040.1 hypothetical protein DFJ58DRAFT_906805 [Suillus subalutaceus]
MLHMHTCAMAFPLEPPHCTFTTRTITIWSIISSSVLTLFACIYSAIHPNIPSPKDSPLLMLWRRLGVMIMALIAPELIVTWAMRQWFSAHRLLVLMGGFMLYVDGKPYHTLQPYEVLNLIRAKCIDLITRAIYHLETTQLETGTLAFAVLNFLTYAVWWNKPLDVQCPYPVYWEVDRVKARGSHY